MQMASLSYPADACCEQITRDELIVYYSLSGFTNSVIKRFLARHGFHLSERHIRRLRQRVGVNSRSIEAPLSEICASIRVRIIL